MTGAFLVEGFLTGGISSFSFSVESRNLFDGYLVRLVGGRPPGWDDMVSDKNSNVRNSERQCLGIIKGLNHFFMKIEIFYNITKSKIFRKSQNNEKS